MNTSTELLPVQRLQLATRVVAAYAAARQLRRPVERPPARPDAGEPTLRELAVAAVRVLRRRASRHAAPAAVPVRRRRLRTVALVALIALASTALACAAWSAAVDYRVRVAGPAAPDVRVLEVSLEAPDQSAELVRDVGGAPAGRRAASRPAHSAATAGGVALEGPVLGGAVAGAILLAGVAVARAVWRRSDSGQDRPGRLDPVAEDADEAADDEPADDEPDDGAPEDGAPEDGDGVDEPHGLDARGGDPADVDQQRDSDDDADRAGAVQPDGAWSDVDRPDEGSRARAADERPVAAADDAGASSRRSVAAPPDAHAERLSGGPTPVYAERIFERRRAPRVPVDLSAVLRWRDGDRAVDVNELSAGGLRLRVRGPVAVADPARRLREREPVRLVVTTAHGEVAAGAQIAWRQLEGGDLVAGVQFTALSDAARSVLVAVLRDAGAADASP